MEQVKDKNSKKGKKVFKLSKRLRQMIHHRAYFVLFHVKQPDVRRLIGLLEKKFPRVPEKKIRRIVNEVSQRISVKLLEQEVEVEQEMQNRIFTFEAISQTAGIFGRFLAEFDKNDIHYGYIHGSNECPELIFSEEEAADIVELFAKMLDEGKEYFYFKVTNESDLPIPLFWFIANLNSQNLTINFGDGVVRMFLPAAQDVLTALYQRMNELETRFEDLGAMVRDHKTGRFVCASARKVAFVTSKRTVQKGAVAIMQYMMAEKKATVAA